MIADLRDFVLAHGGSLTEGGRAALIPGPGHSKRDRSLSLRLSPEGRVVYYDHSGGHSHSEIAGYLGLDTARRYQADDREIRAAKARRAAERAALEAEKLAFCRDIWDATQPISGTPAEAYLAARGIQLECDDIRWSPAAPRAVPWNESPGGPPPPLPHQGMVCLARDRAGTPKGLHVTFISDQGLKAFGDRSRIMIGPMVGAALRLAPASADGILAVAEGLETAASFARLRDLPTWAVFSTSGLRNFEVPLEVRRLIIAADNDANDAGRCAGTDLAERVRGRCDVELYMPTDLGDWNDDLMKERPRA